MNAHVPPVQSASRPRQAPLSPQQPDRLVNYARPSLQDWPHVHSQYFTGRGSIYSVHRAGRGGCV